MICFITDFKHVVFRNNENYDIKRFTIHNSCRELLPMYLYNQQYLYIFKRLRGFLNSKNELIDEILG